jgi:ferric-dicitrate binding protein FerR (iron transport regulator)
MTEQFEPRDDGSMSARDVTSLVTLFVTMLASTKAEIIAAMDANSHRAAERWQTHEREHASTLGRLADLERELHAHLDKEERDDLIMDARIRPLRTLGHRAVLHWRDIVIFLFALLALLGVGTDLSGVLK